MTDTPILARTESRPQTGYERVFSFLRDQLLSGRLSAGDRLLPERELALKLGVSRPVIREVLRALAALGVVEIRHGQGSVIRQPDFSELADFFTLMLAQKAEVVDDIMEARIAIERQAAHLACQRAIPADFHRLSAALEQIRQTMGDTHLGGDADYAFHTALVDAAHSPTLSSLYAAIANLLRRSHHERRERVAASQEIEASLVAHHQKLLDTLQARNPAELDALLIEHFAIGAELHRRARGGA